MTELTLVRVFGHSSRQFHQTVKCCTNIKALYKVNIDFFTLMWSLIKIT